MTVPHFGPGHLVLSEVFGPTIQGEGPSIGTPAFFVRTGVCNLACVWCDTAYTWDWQRFDPGKELYVAKVDDVMADVVHSGVDLLVISGGEPMLQQPALGDLIQKVRHETVQPGIPAMRVEIETAGTRLPIPGFPDNVVTFNVSPKLEHSGNPESKRRKIEVLRRYRALDSIFKFVVQQAEDFEEVDYLCEQIGLRYGDDRVYIMPEGTDSERLRDVSIQVVDEVIHRGWHLTPRLHIEIWGSQRGH